MSTSFPFGAELKLNFDIAYVLPLAVSLGGLKTRDAFVCLLREKSNLEARVFAGVGQSSALRTRLEGKLAVAQEKLQISEARAYALRTNLDKLSAQAARRAAKAAAKAKSQAEAVAFNQDALARAQEAGDKSRNQIAALEAAVCRARMSERETVAKLASVRREVAESKASETKAARERDASAAKMLQLQALVETLEEELDALHEQAASWLKTTQESIETYKNQGSLQVLMVPTSARSCTALCCCRS